MLDHTTIIWTNELGKGNTHTHNDIPFVVLGKGMGLEMGRSLEFGGVPHNRMLLSLAHSFGHDLKSFGSEKHCEGGVLDFA